MITVYYSAQPGANSISAAYRPVVVYVNTTFSDTMPIPPVMYLDIYFGNVYYKTLSKTNYSLVSIEDTQWQFDLQDAAQEYLKYVLGENGGTTLLDAPALLTSCFCRVRATEKDANGFIVSQGVVPVQATGSSAAQSGGGQQSNTFFIVNATLQHDDNQSLATHLNSFKRRTWNSSAYPLTHRPDSYHIGVKDSDYFPALLPAGLCITGLTLFYRLKGQTTIRTKQRGYSLSCNGVVSGITPKQATGTQNVTVTWVGTGDITGYYYQLDEDGWVLTSATTVTFNDLEIGEHTLLVSPVCQCSQGNITQVTFTVLTVGSFGCPSVVTDLAITQTGQGAATFTFSSSGPAEEWARVVDGNRATYLEEESGLLEGLAVGTHTITITPVCSNGSSGTPQSTSFTIQPAPAITKIGETSAGPGSIRTQVFEIGNNVNSGNIYKMALYLHEISVTAVFTDSSSTIATKLKNAINATSISAWNDHSAAPPVGTNGFPPVATSTGNQLTVSFDWQNSFTYSATIS